MEEFSKWVCSLADSPILRPNARGIGATPLMALVQCILADKDLQACRSFDNQCGILYFSVRYLDRTGKLIREVPMAEIQLQADDVQGFSITKQKWAESRIYQQERLYKLEHLVNVLQQEKNHLDSLAQATDSIKKSFDREENYA